MIQLNLLPDVKQEYIHAQQSRRLVFTISAIAVAASVGLLLLLISVGALQKKHINDLTKDIATQSRQLQNKPQITKILTVQNQLQSLTALHDSKPAASRLFEYLNQVTPAQVNITSFTIDFTQNTVTITGTADSLGSVNKYIDGLKYITYTTDENSTKQPAFSNVVLTSFGLNKGSKDSSQAASYTITMSYDTTIFDVTKKVKISIPNVTTTRAQLDSPTDLFRAPVTTPTTGGTR